MSLQIPIQKDIGEYQEKIVGKMSLRTLVCLSCGFASAIAAACLVYFCLGIPVANATLPVMAAALPFWLAGFWRPFGMRLEEFLPLLADHHLNSQRMLYRPCAALEAPAPPARRAMTRRQARAFRKKGGELREPSKEQD
ncbi:PrgI family protein [Slackia isoflavoniconvertens]|uniref:PrgI family protein n=1 Tax=Slackia isoflavoniconvertens TaxID=572010 RepID=UPI003F9667B4